MKRSRLTLIFILISSFYCTALFAQGSAESLVEDYLAIGPCDEFVTFNLSDNDGDLISEGTSCRIIWDHIDLQEYEIPSDRRVYRAYRFNYLDFSNPVDSIDTPLNSADFLSLEEGKGYCYTAKVFDRFQIVTTVVCSKDTICVYQQPFIPPVEGLTAMSMPDGEIELRWRKEKDTSQDLAYIIARSESDSCLNLENVFDVSSVCRTEGQITFVDTIDVRRDTVVQRLRDTIEKGLEDGNQYYYIILPLSLTEAVRWSGNNIDSAYSDATDPSSNIGCPEKFIKDLPIAFPCTTRDATTGVDQVRLRYSYNGDLAKACGDSQSPSDSCSTILIGTFSFDFDCYEGDGVYEFWFEAEDCAGNMEKFDIVEVCTVVIDTTAPAIDSLWAFVDATELDTIFQDWQNKSNTPFFTWWEKHSASGVMFYIYLNGGLIDSTDNPQYKSPHLEQGIHQFRIQARSGAGLYSRDTLEYIIRYDNSAPNCGTISVVDKTSESITICTEEFEDSYEGTVRYTFHLVESPEDSSGLQEETCYTFDELTPNREYHFNIKAFDGVIDTHPNHIRCDTESTYTLPVAPDVQPDGSDPERCEYYFTSDALFTGLIDHYYYQWNTVNIDTPGIGDLSWSEDIDRLILTGDETDNYYLHICSYNPDNERGSCETLGPFPKCGCPELRWIRVYADCGDPTRRIGQDWQNVDDTPYFVWSATYADSFRIAVTASADSPDVYDETIVDTFYCLGRELGEGEHYFHILPVSPAGRACKDTFYIIRYDTSPPICGTISFPAEEKSSTSIRVFADGFEDSFEGTVRYTFHLVESPEDSSGLQEDACYTFDELTPNREYHFFVKAFDGVADSQPNHVRCDTMSTYTLPVAPDVQFVGSDPEQCEYYFTSEALVTGLIDHYYYRWNTFNVDTPGIGDLRWGNDLDTLTQRGDETSDYYLHLCSYNPDNEREGCQTLGPFRRCGCPELKWIRAYAECDDTTRRIGQEWQNIDDTPYFVWSASYAESFRIAVTASADSPDVYDETIVDTFYCIERGLGEGEHYFHILPVSPAGRACDDTFFIIRFDATAPGTVIPLNSNSIPYGRIELGWDEVEDNFSGVAKYYIFRDGEKLDSVLTPGYVDTQTENCSTYCYEIHAIDNAGNEQFQGDITCSISDALPLWGWLQVPDTSNSCTFNIKYSVCDSIRECGIGIDEVHLNFLVFDIQVSTRATTFSPPDCSLCIEGIHRFSAKEDFGLYKFWLEAQDCAGNKSVSDTASTFVNCKMVPSPDMHDEPQFTQGIENEVCWSDTSGIDGLDYLVQCFLPDSAVICSVWTSDTCYTFGPITQCILQDGKTYSYRVKARNIVGTESEWSNTVWSTQDNTIPKVDSLEVLMETENLNLEWIFHKDCSVHVEASDIPPGLLDFIEIFEWGTDCTQQYPITPPRINIDTTFIYTISCINNGEITIGCRVFDVAGNISQEDSYTIFLDILEEEVVNFPNPFNPKDGPTKIRVRTNERSDVKVKIFDIFGNLVVENLNGPIDNSDGFADFHWDGTNDNNDVVASGGYICVVEVDGRTLKARKIAVRK